MSFVSETPVLDAAHDEDARMLRATAEVARILGAGGPLDETLTRCAQALADDLNLAFARVWTCDAGGRLRPAGGGHGSREPALPWSEDGDRVLQRVIAMRRSFWAPNLKYALSEPTLPWVRAAGMGSFAVFPLVNGSEVYGALAIASRGTANTRMLCGLQSAAWILGVGVAQRRAAEALASRTTRQTHVAELGDLVTGGAPLAQVLEHAAQAVARGLGVEYVEMLELEPEGQTLLMRAGLGWSGAENRRVIAREVAVAQPLRTGEPVVVEDSAPRLALTAYGVASGVCLAIPGPHGAFGLLGAHARMARRYSDEDIAFLRAVAGVVGIAYDRERDRAGTAPVPPTPLFPRVSTPAA